MTISKVKLVAVCLLLLGVGSLLSSPILPLYDGIGFPDEPYRYLVLPTGAQAAPTPAPTGAQGMSPITNGSNSEVFQVATPETAPQAMVVILPGHLLARAGGASPPAAAQLTVSPIKPTVVPDSAKLTGNVYLVQADAAGAQLQLDAGDIAENSQYISMRLPQADVDNRSNAPLPRIAYRSNGSQKWQLLATNQTGTDIYQSVLRGFGEYAVVIPKPDQKSPTAVATRQPKSKLPFIATATLVTLSLAAFGIIIARRAVKRRSDRAKTSA